MNWIRPTENLSSCNDRDFDHKVDHLQALDPQNQHFILSAYEVIRARYFPASRRNIGLRMRVFCQQPTRSGMNSSGSIAAALVIALSAYFAKPPSEAELDSARGPLDAAALSQSYQRGSATFESLATLGWFLDDCLHGLGGSAIGSVGALLGAPTGLPFIFMAEARTGLSADALRSADDYLRFTPAGTARTQVVAPRKSFFTRFDRKPHPARSQEDDRTVVHPFNYKHLADRPAERLDAMSTLKRMVIRLDDVLGSGSPFLPSWWDQSGIAVVYGGDPKYTRDMLDKMSGRLEGLAGTNFVTDVLDLAAEQHMQLSPLDAWLRRTSRPPYQLNMREWYRLIGPVPDRDDSFFHLEWRKQQRKELMMLLMGGTSYSCVECAQCQATV